MSFSQRVEREMSLDAIPIKTWQDCALLAFLYDKDVVTDISLNDPLRMSFYRAIIHPVNRDLSVALRFERGYQMLLQIMSIKGALVLDHIPSDVVSWDDSLRLMPQWSDPKTSFVFHRDDLSILSENRELMPSGFINSVGSPAQEPLLSDSTCGAAILSDCKTQQDQT